MKPREERSVFERELDEGIFLLLEWEIDSNAERLSLARGLNTCVRCLHEAGTTTGDNVATHLCKRGCSALRFLICDCSRLCSGRAKYGHSIAIAFRWLESRQIVYNIPEAEY